MISTVKISRACRNKQIGIMKEKEKSSLVDLGKRLLEASRKGHADEVSMLMASGAPFTTDWVR